MGCANFGLAEFVADQSLIDLPHEMKSICVSKGDTLDQMKHDRFHNIIRIGCADPKTIVFSQNF